MGKGLFGYIGRVGDDNRNKVSWHRFTLTSLQDLAARAGTQQVAGRLQAAADGLQYQSPVSYDALLPLEQEITALIEELVGNITVEDGPGTAAAMQELESSLAQRKSWLQNM